ncbi:MOP flippase family protein [Escherichia coli]|uniref:MOP flippase family protein n=1 Tax=Escherichia coli TaxID=562 RepID=UPI00273E8A65|nr:MOP flippase family protein [Escherichia coli]MDP5295190.1 MOP flippase family protein [Escherichia coli]
MSTSIRICSYLLLPLIYLLVNVKIAQLGESFPITIVTFLPVLLLLFLERISVKKLMIALGIGAGLTAFNYLFGQSLDASKYVTSTMLFVYIVIIIGMVWSIRFKTISPHNHRKILRFFYLVVGLVVSNNFVPLVFGEKWNSIIPVLQLLCVVGLLRSVGNPIGSLLMAKARVDISFKFNVFKTFLFIPAIVIGGQMAGAIGVTLGFLLVQIINTILSYFVMIKPVLGSSYRQYILSLWLPFYLSLPTLVVSYALGIVLKGQLALGMLLAVQIATGVLAFVVMIVLSRHPLVVEVKRQFCRSEKMKMLLRAG